MSFIKLLYSSTEGSLPRIDEIAANSAEARNTSAPSPSRFGKFLVEVETTVEFGSTLA